MYDLTLRLLSDAGYEQYEISNFAKKGFECAHNIGYWRQEQWLGLGAAATSMRGYRTEDGGITFIRRTNPDTLEGYEACVMGVRSPETEIVSREDARFETMMLSLRMMEGISEARFQALHGVSLESCYGEKLRSLEARGLLYHEKSAWRLTRRGMDIQNAILVELMDD